MILSGEAILERLRDGQVFREGTWYEGSIREASYALRVADDGLLVNGQFYDPGVPYTETYIAIEPGKIAILSTVERLNMPGDLVGKVGVRFNPAIKGLTGLMGIQVDPLYGQTKDDERLFVRVANLGNDTVKFLPNEIVFTFELHELTGNVRSPSPEKTSTWERIKRQLATQDNSSWSYVTQVQHETVQVERRLRAEITNIKDYLQPLVMFGIFLVAVTILGVAMAVIVSVRETPEVYVPDWITSWGWIILMCTLSVATAVTAAIGGFTVWRLAKGK